MPKFQSKSTVQKIADDLAAKSRILRKAAEQPAADDVSPVVDRLAQLAEDHRADEQAARNLKAAEARAAYMPLIERAERCIADNAAAVAEVSPLIRRLSTIDWKAVRARARIVPIPGSLEDASTRLALLQRTVEEAAEFLRGTDQQLVGYVEQLKECIGSEGGKSRDFEWPRTKQSACEYYANGIRGTMHPRGEMLRAKAGAIRRILATVAADLHAVDAAITEQTAVVEEASR